MPFLSDCTCGSSFLPPFISFITHVRINVKRIFFSLNVPFSTIPNGGLSHYMDIGSLELFIDLRESGSLSATAKNHYLTESTVSKRLVSLENELGVRLFERGKGRNRIRLTVEGAAFYDIARRMLILNTQAMHLQDNRVRHYLTVSSINSMQDYSLPDFIKAFRKEHPEIFFSLEDHRSTGIYTLLEHQRIDIGITQAPSPYPDLEALLLFEEEYRVVFKKEGTREEYGHGIHPSALKAGHEIYESYCDIFREWHDQWWPPFQSKIRVNITPTAEKYFEDPDDWMIVPACIADYLDRKGYVSYPFSVKAPRHQVYIAYHKDYLNQDIPVFVDAILQYYKERKKKLP